MKHLTIALCCLLSTLLLSCTADESINRDYRCSFVFDTSLHPLPCSLTGIMGNPGHFCIVQSSIVRGVTQLKATRNYDNATENILLSTEREHQTVIALGANNCIIIGTSSYDNRLLAYDGQCPNCLKDKGGYSYPLTWQQGGLQLYCNKCSRSYDVNNGTVASGEGGRQLLAYYAAFDGRLIRAWN